VLLSAACHRQIALAKVFTLRTFADRGSFNQISPPTAVMRRAQKRRGQKKRAAKLARTAPIQMPQCCGRIAATPPPELGGKKKGHQNRVENIIVACGNLTQVRRCRKAAIRGSPRSSGDAGNPTA